jgi:hypothetical protein
MEEQPQVQNQQEQQQDAERRYKTLGVRLEEGIHAQLSFISQLKGSTLGDEIKASIEAHVVAAQSDPELIERAQRVREQIEREAKARQAAIAGLFGAVALSSEVESKPAPRRGRGSTDSTN